MDFNDGIIGTCMEMCPAEEREQRERVGLLHRVETVIYSKNCSIDGKKKMTADPRKIIKCFSRSAAGQMAPKPSTLRPSPVLFATVEYLVRHVVPLWKDRPLDIYEYVTDRFRAIRQDMTIQRLLPDQCIPILEPMIRFHVIFGYVLCEQKHFETHLNDTYLNECMLKILECYSHDPKEKAANQREIESIYSCVNVKTPEYLIKRIHFEQKSIVLDLLAAWSSNNYWRCFQLISKLDALPRASLARHVPEFRTRALRTLCHAMSSQNSVYPLERLALTLFYNNVDNALEDCKLLGIRHSETECYFLKKDLILDTAKTIPQKWFLVDEVLTDDFSSMILK